MGGETLQVLALAVVLALLMLLLLQGFGGGGNSAAERAREAVRAVGGQTAANKGEDGEPTDTVKARTSVLLAKLGGRLPLFNAKQREKVRLQLQGGGFRQGNAVPIFVTLKLLCGGVGVVLGVVVIRVVMDDAETLIQLLLVLGGLQLGLLVPELVLRRLVRDRRRAIYRALPDALDLMVICTNAGYSLGGTIKRLSVELRGVCTPLAEELEITAHEIQVNGDPVEALRHLSDRTGLESLRAVVATLIQAHQFGTPITQSLKTLARTERTTRLLTLEEKGAKLASKMTMPMMLLILPAVMLISGAPAFLKMMEMLK